MITSLLSNFQNKVFDKKLIPQKNTTVCVNSGLSQLQEDTISFRGILTSQKVNNLYERAVKVTSGVEIPAAIQENLTLNVQKSAAKEAGIESHLIAINSIISLLDSVKYSTKAAAQKAALIIKTSAKLIVENDSNVKHIDRYSILEGDVNVIGNKSTGYRVNHRNNQLFFDSIKSPVLKEAMDKRGSKIREASDAFYNWES